jgi:hypothetical protein
LEKVFLLHLLLKHISDISLTFQEIVLYLPQILNCCSKNVQEIMHKKLGIRPFGKEEEEEEEAVTK